MRTYGDAISMVRRLGGCCTDRIRWLMKVKIKPWLLWVGNEQAISLKPANYALDHSIE